MSDPQLDSASANPPFADRYGPLLEALPAELGTEVETLRAIHLPADRPPWTDTGIELRKGQWFSLFATGRVAWSPRHVELWAGPRHHLWGRIGGGKIFNPTQDTTTRCAESAGRLELGLLHGIWANEYGELGTPRGAYKSLTGGIEVLIVLWRGAPDAGLHALAIATSGDSLVVAECDRRAHPVAIPPGWTYLYETGFSDVYSACETPHGPGIRIHAINDQGILRKAVAFPLGPDTTLCWRWRFDSLPSQKPEDQAIHHDYMSIAMEFEDGRDLTWFWSSTLEPGRHFVCPIRAWSQREFHYCIRSGSAGLGTWHRETRNVYDDCREVLGAAPERIVRAWLIAVSTFQHGTARAEFADIALQSERDRVQVL